MQSLHKAIRVYSRHPVYIEVGYFSGIRNVCYSVCSLFSSSCDVRLIFPVFVLFMDFPLYLCIDLKPYIIVRVISFLCFVDIFSEN